MTRYLLRRLALLPVVLLAVSLATFLFLRFIPGDPEQILLGEHANAGQTAAMRAENGPGRALPLQYLDYLGNLTRGNWGIAIRTNRPVLAELAERAPATIELAVAALLIACILGIPLGVFVAARRHSWADRLVSGASLGCVSVPLFAIGLLAAYVFGYQLGWLPPSGRLSVESSLVPLTHSYIVDSLLRRDLSSFADALRHLILPALVLSTAALAVILKQTRAAVQDVLTQPHFVTARAKGLPERMLLARHAWRNATPPVITTIGSLLGFLLSGAILTETVFSWPGIGQYVVERVLGRDYPAVQGAVLVVALLVAFSNLAADLLSAWLDPRVRHAE